MRIDPNGEAFFNERLAAAHNLPVTDLQVGRRFAPDSDFVYIAASPRHAGGWPGGVWRVGSLEGVKTRYRWLVTADAFTPLERLEPWQSFGPQGQRVVDILDRLAEFDDADLARVRRRLTKSRRGPITRARIAIPSSMRAGSPETVVQRLVLSAAERTDPDAVVDRSWENDFQGEPRSLESPLWHAIGIVAGDAATAVFVDADSEKATRLERRFWRLVEPAA
jgi:hypothetical protein